MKNTLDLASARWTLRDLSAGTPPVAATAPGCVHTALLAAGLLPPDLHAPGAEAACAWIGEHDWLYRVEFDAPPALLAHEHIDLLADSLDCLAPPRHRRPLRRPGRARRRAR